jgi:hypothetical protein
MFVLPCGRLRQRTRYANYLFLLDALVLAQILSQNKLFSKIEVDQEPFLGAAIT